MRKYLSTLSRLGRPRQYRDAATIAVLMFGQAAYADLLIEIDKSTQRMTAVIHSQACEARRGIFRGESAISPAAALYQVPRVARTRGLSEDVLKEFVARYTENRWLGFIGEERVNVLKLNLALDSIRLEIH